jgi:pimeloyl-ACP methyl ester carboxylesterase
LRGVAPEVLSEKASGVSYSTEYIGQRLRYVATVLISRSTWSPAEPVAARAADEFEAAARSQGLAPHTDARSITVTSTDSTTNAEGTGEYAEVNGINLYVERHGSGRPMVLLHGGLGSGEMFGPVLAMLAQHHHVIVPDLQGHGRTADIDRPIDVRLMADDIAALIDDLGLETPDLVGYSLGGGVALHAAAKYPAKVRRLVVVSTNIRRDAIYPEMLAQQGQVSAAAAEFMKDTPMYQLYQRVAPRPEDFPRLLDKIGESMSKDFDFAQDVRSLAIPTLIVAADADMAPPSHYVEVFKLLDGGLRDGGWMGEGRPGGGHALAILPGLTHYNICTSPLLAAAVISFLDGQPT